MRRPVIGIFVVLAFLAGYACTSAVKEPAPAPAPAAPPADATPPPVQPVGATLLQGLGNYHRPITTSKPEAQRWFDQGLMLTYGFNHDAAERSFLKAAEIDPECAMCWWGAALVLGPHVNATMDPANNAKAWMRVQKATSLAAKAGAWEQAFIQALTARYAENAPSDRAPLDLKYANAMDALTKRLPDDLDAATMYAEALMDLQPWDYYDAKGMPKGNTEQAVAVLESVMKRDANHAGALHLYIHAVEASLKPERGVDAADRLRALIPGSGHLVHMPAHIYTRVGRYHDAVVANQKAIAADDAYLATCTPAPGVYPLGYVPHNHHFLWWASSMEGASARALAAADETAKRANIPDLIGQPGFEFLQDFYATPIKAKVQFGRWDELVAMPRPADNLPYPQAMWHFGVGMALVHQNHVPDAKPHLDALAKAAANPMFEKFMVGPKHPLSQTLRVAERVLAGEIAAAGKDYDAAIFALEQAVAAEDSHVYYEPPLWHHPVRQTLGAVLLQAGQAAKAEQVFRDDLNRNPNNGWSLWGLAQTLKAQKKLADAAKVEEQFKKAWRNSDLTLTAALF